MDRDVTSSDEIPMRRKKFVDADDAVALDVVQGAVAARGYAHYQKCVDHLRFIDVYRVLDLFEVTDPGLQHAIKKLLVAGGRGAKNVEKDIKEAIDACQRSLEMRQEDMTRR